MKLVLPKASRGYYFDRLFLVEMNDFDVERLLPSLFYLTVSKGRRRSGSPNDPTSIAEYVRRLASHPSISMSADAATLERLLDQWVRQSVLKMGKTGRRHRGEQIEAVLPVTFGCYKSGFPAETSRQRNVHSFLYRCLVDALKAVDYRPTAEAGLAALFTTAFGAGVRIGAAPHYDAKYDGQSVVDVQTLLALTFLDGFQPTPASQRDQALAFGPALPTEARQLAVDMLLFVGAYHAHMPPLALTRGLLALIGLELLVYTLSLIHRVNRLVADPAYAPADDAVPPFEIYVDFTRERGSVSDQLAKSNVERHLEELRAFYDSSMLLRTLDRFVQFHGDLQRSVQHLDTPHYLAALASLASDPAIEARAAAELESIQHETLEACATDAERAEATAWFDDVKRQSESALTRAVRALSKAQSKKAIESYVSWYWSAGGLRKPFGLLAGNLTGRRNWRYAMSDELLLAIVQLAMAENPSGDFSNVTTRARVRLPDFLEFLRMRFGILVDRPPAADDSVAARAAARDNLEALRRRLRQMGWFEALSDDFAAQYLRNPLRNGAAA
jgi:hypothetical protein